MGGSCSSGKGYQYGDPQMGQMMPGGDQRMMMPPRDDRMMGYGRGFQRDGFPYRDDMREQRRYDGNQTLGLKVCGGCCACCVVFWLLAFLIVVLTSTTTILGTQFTFFNYFWPMWWNYWCALDNDSGESVRRWYASLAYGHHPMIGQGPGPNTMNYYGWQDARDLFGTFEPRTRDGTMRRYNEVGMYIVDTGLWPETGKSIFGLTDTEHAAIRPYLASTLDGAMGAWDEHCYGGDCWNRAWIEQAMRTKLQSLTALSKDDLRWIITQILHKIHLNIDMSDSEAQDFARYQGQVIAHLPYKRNILNIFTARYAGYFPASTRSDYLETYKAAIMQKWSNENWQAMPEKLTMVASAMLDSMTLAGGYTLPKALDVLLALIHMNGNVGEYVRRELDIMNDGRAHIWRDEKLKNYIVETLRRFSPVVAVPRWITDDGGLTWRHQIVNVEMAFKDPAVFPEPMEFQLGRPGFNNADTTLEIGCNPLDGWAAFDPFSQPCLAKELSMEILTIFLKEFHMAGPWTVEDGNIGLHTDGTSGWRVIKSR